VSCATTMDLSDVQQPPVQITDDDSPSPRTNGYRYRDPAAAILSMYLPRVQKLEDENVENWKGNAEGILVFVRFCCAPTVAISLLFARLASFPRPWLLSLPSAIRTCSKIPTSPPNSSSHKYPNSFQMPLQALRVHLPKVHSSLPLRWYLSIPFGFSASSSALPARF